MTPHTTALFLVAILAACSGADPAFVLANGRPIPAEIERSASAWANTQPATTDVLANRDRYLADFLEGFVHGGTPDGTAGFRAGAAYRLANPDRVPDVMAGFGYELFEGEGEYTGGFEASLFTPRQQPDRRWWLVPMADLPELPQVDAAHLATTSNVRIKGYLSPAGRFGHLDKYAHRVLALSMAVTAR